MHPPNCHYHPDLCRELYHPEPPTHETPEPPTMWLVGLALAFAIILANKYRHGQ